MDREALRQSILQKLEEDTGEKFPELDDSKNLRTQLGIDSVDLLQLVISIQSEFGIVLTSKDLEKITLVGEFLDLVQEKLAAAKKSAA
jgi:acyl carrier protein